jgi:hypothetical protein
MAMIRCVRGRYGVVLALGGWLGGGCDAHAGPDYQGEALASLQGRVEASGAVSEADVGVLWLASSPGDECSGPVRSCPSIAYASATQETQQCIEGCGDSPECQDTERVAQWEACMADCGIDDAKVEYDDGFQLCVSAAVGQTATVNGDFPARFTVDLLTPPPERALLRDSSGSRAALGYIVALKPGSGQKTIEMGSEDAGDWLLGLCATHILLYAADPIVEGSPWSGLLGAQFDVGYHLLQEVEGVTCVADRVDNPIGAPGPAPLAAGSTGLPDDSSPSALNGEGGSSGLDSAPASAGAACEERPDGVIPAPDGFDTDVTLVIGPRDEMRAPPFPRG